jgi:hypothetical protein
VLPDDKNAVLRRRWCDGGAATLGLAAAAWVVALASPPSSDRSVIDVPQATAIVTIGIVIAVAPSSIPGLT